MCTSHVIFIAAGKGFLMGVCACVCMHASCVCVCVCQCLFLCVHMCFSIDGTEFSLLSVTFRLS